MKTCKRCSAQIPASASVCEHCGNRQRIGGLGIAVVVVCVVAAAGWIAVHKASGRPGQQSAADKSVSMCEAAVRKAASHPDSIDFSAFGRQPPTHLHGGGYLVRLDFAEKNATGDSIARDAICMVKDGKLESFREPKP